MAKKRTMADVVAELNARIKEGNKLIADGALTVDFLAGFANPIKEYNEFKAIECYNELMAEELPMIAAIKRYSYEVMRLNEVTDSETKAVTKLELATKDKQIDLLKFAKYADMDTSWQHNVSLYNQTLCLRAGLELGYSAKEIADVADTMHIAKQVREMARGKTPTSNNALCKALQDVIDAILPPADETLGNIYKCNNHDVKFLLMCYTKKGRKALSVAIARDGFLRNLVMDVMHRIIENKLYSLEYKTRKDGVMVRSEQPTPDVEPAEDFDGDIDEPQAA